MRTFLIFVIAVGVCAGLYIGTYNTGPGTVCTVRQP